MTIPEQTKLHTLETSTLQNPSAHSFDSTDPKHQPCSLVLSSIKANASEDDLRHLFGGVGKVVGCKIVRDEKSKNHTGLGFVMMSNQADAHEAKKKFDGFLVHSFFLQLRTPILFRFRLSDHRSLENTFFLKSRDAIYLEFKPSSVILKFSSLKGMHMTEGTNMSQITYLNTEVFFSIFPC